MSELVTLAQAAGIRELWLLTTNTERFFERLGFERMNRADAPASIAATSQFAGLCPASAIVMRKQLT
jgi:amino-acid N-acetyltransferase